MSVLLQYVDTRTAFQFFHTITGRLAGVDARAVFYVDPTFHDEQTLATVAAAFDDRRTG
ncbi:hypothetical protein [Halosegnis sp.]|uniref:DUF7504 family protein n=1 Tax=Halosegnis sp. TaxID=2864959 RepID=UPI0035D3ED27